jgi:hypothetical protein
VQLAKIAAPFAEKKKLWTQIHGAVGATVMASGAKPQAERLQSQLPPAILKSRGPLWQPA